MPGGAVLAKKPKEKPPEEVPPITKMEVVQLLNEDTSALSEETKKIKQNKRKTINKFIAKYGSAGSDKLDFYNGKRATLHVITKGPISEKKKESFLKDCEELAKIGFGVSFLPDGSIQLINYNFIPKMSEEKEKLLIGFLKKAMDMAEKGNIQGAMAIHMAFLSIIDCERAKNDCGLGIKLASSQYQWNEGADLESLDIFVDPKGKFSEEKFEEILGISYADYRSKGFGYLAELNFNSAEKKYEVAGTFYIDVMRSIVDGYPIEEYEKKYIFAKESEVQAGVLFNSGDFILRVCKNMDDIKEEIVNVSDLVVGVGFESPYAKKKAKGEIPPLNTTWGQEAAYEPVKSLVNALRIIRHQQKLLLVYTLTGNYEGVETAHGKIENLQNGYPKKFETAVDAYNKSEEMELKIKALEESASNLREEIKLNMDENIIAENAGKILLKRLGEVEKEVAKIKNASSFKEAEKLYNAAVDGYQEVAAAEVASVIFETSISDAKTKLSKAKKDKEKTYKTVVYGTNVYKGEELVTTAEYTEDALSADEKELFDALEDAAKEYTKEYMKSDTIVSALNVLRNSYNPFGLLKKNTKHDKFADDVQDKKMEKVFESFDAKNADVGNLFALVGFIDSLYVLTWKGREGEIPFYNEGRKAINVMLEFVVPAIKDKAKKAELEKKAKKLMEQSYQGYKTKDRYTEFVSGLFEVLKEEAFDKVMADKSTPWYKKIGPAVAFYLDKYELEITIGMTVASLIIAGLTAQPEAAAGGSTVGRVALTQTIKKLGGVALKRLLSPKELVKMMFTKQSLFKAVEWGVALPFMVGGTITGIDGIAKYFTSEGVEKEQALDQIRTSAFWLSIGVGSQSLVTKGPMMAASPWFFAGKTALSATTHGLFFTALGISMVERFKGENIDWMGLAGDTAFLTIGGISVIRSVGGFKVLKKSKVGSKLIKKDAPAVLIGTKTAALGEMGLFVGGTAVYASDVLTPAQKAELAEKQIIIDELSKTPAMEKVGGGIAEVAESAIDIEQKKKADEVIASLLGALPQITEKERKEMNKDMMERMITATLFPDVFEQYYSAETTEETRSAVTTELSKKLGVSADIDVFTYLTFMMDGFVKNPDNVKDVNSELYKFFKTREVDIKANIGDIKKYSEEI